MSDEYTSKNKTQSGARCLFRKENYHEFQIIILTTTFLLIKTVFVCVFKTKVLVK
jgi:hypothetical protein